jgi:tetratricopeptide (TPR) repeat protein
VQIRIIGTLQEFAAIRDNWDRVYRNDPDAQFFLSSAWLSQWLAMLVGPWFILAAKPRDSNDFVAFMPLRTRLRERKHGDLCNEINMAGNYQADYTGFICLPEFDRSAIPAFAKYICNLHWARIHLENIRTTESRLRLFFGGFPQGKFGIKAQDRINKRDNIDNCICPFACLPDDWGGYLETLSANTRQKLRRFLRQVEGDSNFHFTRSTADTIERDVNILLQFWASKWGPRKGNRLNNILRSNFEMLTRTFHNGTLFLPVLWHSNKPVGALATFVDADKKAFLFYMAGRDETFDTPPPGLVLHAYSIRHAIAHGFHTYDFLRGNEPYKYSLASGERRITCAIISTRNGRNLGDRLDVRTLPDAMERAIELHKSGRLKQAEQAYRLILRTDPRCADALYYLGQLKATTGSHGAAKRIFKSLVAVKPDAEKAWLRLGDSLEAKHRYDEAANAYREVIRRLPKLAAAHHRLGGALFKLGRHDEALAAFEQAIALRPGYLEAEVSRANILHMLGRLTREQQAQYAALNATLGDKFRAGRSDTFAVHCYQQALKMKADLVTAHYGLARIMQARGDIDQALQGYRRVIEIDPDHSDAIACLSALAIAAQQDSDALRTKA